MSQAFNFERFVAGKPLLEQLSAQRLNAILDAIDRNRPEFGDNVTGQRTPGGVIIRADAQSSDGAAVKHPFRVYRLARTTPTPASGLAVYPGYISTVMAKINGVLLTATPTPILDVSASTGGFSIFLRVEIEGFSDATFGGGSLSVKRYSVINVNVLTDDQTGDDAEYDLEGEIIEFKVKWDDVTTKNKGHFFIKVADVAAPTEGSPSGTIGTIVQTLFVSYRSILISEEVIVALP